ncbi:CRISPR system precrRNA processing endoribonuclease RAMP protein Cas6 [Solwaraspora sp. WMMB762]|uniref:CRISPR system precrRNA processing endoribonuclease RAMP protein Cas6 n=1 Tax=Solwaraspora sp. WMMB762 TaxID=3404120 RepID=UPI003B9412EB
MPSRWQFVVPGVDPAGVRLEHVHAVVSRWFDVDEAAHRSHAKAYSVSPPVAHPAGTLVEVGLLDDALVDKLRAGAATGAVIRFGGQVGALVTGARQVAGVSWLELARPSGDAAWSLRFLTPATFRRGNGFTPWPDPWSVVAGLRAVWRANAPAGLPELVLPLPGVGGPGGGGPGERPDRDALWVSDIDGTSDVVKVNGRTVSGFLGRIRYVCDGPTALVGAVDRLMRLAPYSGVGAQRGRGFGLVRLEPTWR